MFFSYKFFPNQRTVHGFGQAPTRAANQPQQQGANEGGGGEGVNFRRHNWGRGNVLGQ